MFGYNKTGRNTTLADRFKMSGACSRATDRRNDVTARTVLQPPGGSPIFTPSTRPILYRGGVVILKNLDFGVKSQ